MHAWLVTVCHSRTCPGVTGDWQACRQTATAGLRSASIALGAGLLARWLTGGAVANWLDRGGAGGDLMELNGWSSPQMLEWYGGGAWGAQARRSYDRIMSG
jgi:hypothetical protein